MRGIEKSVLPAPGKVLVINCGSSSIKYHLYEADSLILLAKGGVSRIGEAGSYLEQESGGAKFRKELPVPDHRAGFDLVISTLLDPRQGLLKSVGDISMVGHRAVHGGEDFRSPVIIEDAVIRKMEELIPLAPLHNPAGLTGILEGRRLLPDVPQVAVFDTAFHQSLPQHAYLYALPMEYYDTYRVRKYGFHGASCQYVSRRAADILGQPPEKLRMIVCHLGNGVTLAAVGGGKSIDTSMGLTPLEGLMMGTRSGDIDPGVIFYLHRQAGLTLDEIDRLLNRESGLFGVSGTSNDMREIEEKAGRGDQRCRLAMEMFAYRVKKYIGAYAAALGGLDVLVFTAGIGENSPQIRAMVCDRMEFLGIELDETANRQAGGVEKIISRANVRVKVLVVPTNEEKVIAAETVAVVRGRGPQASSMR